MSTLHDDLSALAAGQPAQPGDRLTAVRARSRRIRRTRAAVAVAAVLAVAVPAGLVAGRAGEGGGGPDSLAASPVMTWPDRTAPEDVGLGAGPLAEYRLRQGLTQADVADVRWLYRGTVDVPGTDDDAAVVAFVVTRAGQQLVVLARASAGDVDGRGVSTRELDVDGLPVDAWVARETAVTAVDAAGFVGDYLPYDLTDQDQRDADGNELFVLAAPEARTMSWTQAPLEASPPAERLGAETSSGDGVFATPVGALVGPVSASVADGDGARSGTSPLVVPDPQLLSPDVSLALVPASAVALPAGFVSSTGAREQSGPSGILSSVEKYANDVSGEALVVVARCYGGGSVRFGLAGGPSGRVTCDGTQQEVLRTVMADGGYRLEKSTDRLVSLTYEVGTR